LRVYKVIVRVSDYPLSDESLCGGRRLGYEVAVIDGSGRYLFTRKVCTVIVDYTEIRGYVDAFLNAKIVRFEKDACYIFVDQSPFEED
jgi:hypothetical protein